MIAEERTVGVASSSQTLVLYDGVCGLCNRLVAFLLRHDRRDQFRFAPLQSEVAQVLLRHYNLDPNDFDTVVVLADFGGPMERALTRSEAALWAVGRLGGIWNLFTAAKLVPLSLREGLYRFVAQRRYRIFGKYDECPLPRPEDRDKFLAHT
jgi:predicted DCC family thiol-disulfide oxidoreductase YuxK